MTKCYVAPGSTRLIPLACLVAALASGCSSQQSQTASTPIGTPPSTGVVTIAGTRLMRDGAPWTLRGVQLNAFVAPPAAQAGVYLAAYQHYSPAELTAAKAWGADTVRFQIGQPEMDPQSPLYVASFAAAVQAAVTQARTDGLNVIVSLQDQAQTGDPSPASLPNAGSLRAWATMTGMFNDDQGIVYELFNEPLLSASAANWSLWQAAHQAVVDQIRASGSKNVLLVEGLAGDSTLAGLPALSDPLAQTGYAIHPFFFPDNHTPAQYDLNFGSFAATNVVVATEWSTLTDGYPEYCTATTPPDSQILLNYLAAKNIGIVGFAFDDPGVGPNSDLIGSIVQDLNGTPTNFNGGALLCGQSGFGPGTMLQGYFKTGVVPSP